MQGQTGAVNVDYIVYANTDSDYPDYIEIQGPGTFITAENPNKDLDFDTDTAYQPIVNTPLQVKDAGSGDEMTVNVPGLGQYPITSGTITMQKFVIGRDGHDWWDGNITLHLETAAGPQTVNGTFSFCIVPVW